LWPSALAIGWEILAVEGEQREIEQGRNAVGHRQHAPGHLHHALDDEDEAEGEEQLGDMAVGMHAAKPEHLDRGP
jgi:hypothetical protein